MDPIGSRGTTWSDLQDSYFGTSESSSYPYIRLEVKDGGDLTDDLERAMREVTIAKRGSIELPPNSYTTSRPAVLDPAMASLAGPFSIVSRSRSGVWTYRPDPAGPYKTRWALEIGNLSGGIVRNTMLDGLHIESGAVGDTGSDHGGIRARVVTGLSMHACTVNAFGAYTTMPSARCLELTGVAANLNCQEVTIVDCSFTNSTINWSVNIATDVRCFGLGCAGAITSNLDLIDVENFSWKDGAVESQAPFGVRLIPTTGQVRNVTFDHVYNETSNSSQKLFYCDAAVGLISGITFRRCTPKMASIVTSGAEMFHLNGVIGATFDDNRAAAPTSGVKWLFARNCSTITVSPSDVLSGSPDAVLDLDATSASAITFQGRASVIDQRAGMSIGTGKPATAGSVLQLAGGVVGLPTFVLGAEPAGYLGATGMYTNGKHAVHDGTRWRTVTYDP